MLKQKCVSPLYNNFGYKSCPDCLRQVHSTHLTPTPHTHMHTPLMSLPPPHSCCNASFYKLPSCTNALSTNFISSSDNLCPSPPKLNPNATVGPLQDKGVFVAEHLLNLSADQGTLIFFNHFQGGFVVSPRDPAFSVCSSPDPAQTNNQFINPVLSALEGVECSGDSSFNSSLLSLGLLYCNCSGSQSGGGTCPAPSTAPLPSCYSVDASSSACFQNNACKKSKEGVSAISVPQDDNVAITVWYNNVVSTLHYVSDCPSVMW